MSHNFPSAHTFRSCVNAETRPAETDPVLCDEVAVALLVVSFPSSPLPDRATAWCAPCLAALDVAAMGVLVPSAVVTVASA